MGFVLSIEDIRVLLDSLDRQSNYLVVTYNDSTQKDIHYRDLQIAENLMKRLENYQPPPTEGSDEE